MEVPENDEGATASIPGREGRCSRDFQAPIRFRQQPVRERSEGRDSISQATRHSGSDLRDQRPSSAPLRVTLGAHDPAVMPGLDLVRLSGSDLRLTAVVAENMKASGQNVADVVRLARVGLRDRLHALGPPPSRLERVATDRRPTDLHHLDLSVVERPRLVGAVHASVRYAHLTPPSTDAPSYPGFLGWWARDFTRPLATPRSAPARRL